MIEKTWEHAGMACCIRHGAFGAPCGYVRVPKGHPLYEAGIDKAAATAVKTYGGFTFAGKLEGEEGWWLGFDMAHYYDLAPTGDGGYEPLRTDRECIEETERLAEQLAAMKEAER